MAPQQNKAPKSKGKVNKVLRKETVGKPLLGKKIAQPIEMML